VSGDPVAPPRPPAEPRVESLAEPAARRHASVEALREHETRLRDTFEAAPVGLGHLSPAGEWLCANPALCGLLGHAEGELVGRRLADVTHPDDRAVVLEAFVRLVGGDADRVRRTARLVRADGAVVAATLAMTLVRAPAPDPLTPGTPFYAVVAVDAADGDEDAAGGAGAAPVAAAAPAAAGPSADGPDAAAAARLRAWVAQSTLAIAVFAPDGRLLEVNPAFTTLYGVTVAELPADYRVTDDPQLAALGVDHLVRRAFAGEAIAMPPLRYDAARTTAGHGRAVWARAHFFPVRDARGVLTEVVQVQEDAAAELEAEEALRVSERRYRLATEAMAGYVYDADLATGRVARTPGFADVVGYWPDEVDATVDWWRAQLHPDDAARVGPELAAGLADPTCAGFTGEYRVRHRDGRWVWVHDRQRFVRDAAGRVTRIVGGASDVTARRAAEAAAAESERRYRELFAGSPVPMMVYDRETLRYLAVNDAAVRRYGYTPDEFRR
jgi:PAS domain S-box-containing protein